MVKDYNLISCRHYLGNSIDFSIITRNPGLRELLNGYVSYPGYNADGCYLQGKLNAYGMLGFAQIFRSGIAEFNMNYIFDAENTL